MKNHYLPHLRTLFTIILGLFLVLNMLKSAMAVPAYPHPIKYEQADGTTLTIVIRGDESLHWQETIDGYTLLRNNKGIFEYAAKNKKNDLVVSGIKAQDPEKRSNVEKKFLKGICFQSFQMLVKPNQIPTIKITTVKIQSGME